MALPASRKSLDFRHRRLRTGFGGGSTERLPHCKWGGGPLRSVANMNWSSERKTISRYCILPASVFAISLITANTDSPKAPQRINTDKWGL